METKDGTTRMLKMLYFLSWFIFVGVSIEAGGFLVGAVFALAKPEVVQNLWLWQMVDLSALFSYGQVHFFTVVVLMSIVALLKAILFYLIIKILHDKKLNMVQPFNRDMGHFIARMSYLSLLIALFAWCGFRYRGWLLVQGVQMPDTGDMRLGGPDVWAFMGIVLLVIAQIFKKGIEIQEEHELTV